MPYIPRGYCVNRKNITKHNGKTLQNLQKMDYNQPKTAEPHPLYTPFKQNWSEVENDISK